MCEHGQMPNHRPCRCACAIEAASAVVDRAHIGQRTRRAVVERAGRAGACIHAPRGGCARRRSGAAPIGGERAQIERRRHVHHKGKVSVAVGLAIVAVAGYAPWVWIAALGPGDPRATRHITSHHITSHVPAAAARDEEGVLLTSNDGNAVERDAGPVVAAARGAVGRLGVWDQLNTHIILNACITTRVRYAPRSRGRRRHSPAQHTR